MKLSFPLVSAALLLALSGCGAGVGSDEPPRAQPSTPSSAAPLSPQPPLPCPASYPSASELWVPHPPAAPGTNERLVPQEAPVSARICEYGPKPFDSPAAPATGIALTQDKALTNLDAVSQDLLLPAKLEGQGRACTLIGSALTPYLMRLDYPSGSVWVTSIQDANSCQDSSNGSFVSSVYLGDRLQEAFKAGAWPAAAAPSSCFVPGGRLGQEVVLVPEGWESVAVCESRLNAPPPPTRSLAPAVAKRAVEILGAAELSPTSAGCSGGSGTSYQLLVSYPSGPPVVVRFFPNCDPPLSNTSLDATLDADLSRELRELLEP